MIKTRRTKRAFSPEFKLEAIEQVVKYQRGITIIISQLPVSEWYKPVGNPTVADALMDRLLHNGHRVELRGESMRKLA